MGTVFILGWMVALALTAVGIYALASPQRLARGYGVHASDGAAAGWVRAAGVRDVALGMALAAAAYFRDLPVLAVVAIAGFLVSIADFIIAYHHGPHKRFHAVHGVHLSGAVAFVLIIAMALFAIGV